MKPKRPKSPKLSKCARAWKREGKPGRWLSYMKKCMKS
jgi:hypothetical protein